MIQNALSICFQEALTPVKTPDCDVALSARDKVLLHCDQTNPVLFTDILTPTMLKRCVKIGEGVYGEVFKTERNKTSVALKVRKKRERERGCIKVGKSVSGTRTVLD